MLPSPLSGPGRIRDIEGHVPLQVVVWLERHPTAVLACALAASAINVRWHYRITSDIEVVLRGCRLEVLDGRSGTRVGAAKIHGIRSPADFDCLPRVFEPPPFLLPDPPYPAHAGFACDLDGRVARFHTMGLTSVLGPALTPRRTGYDLSEHRLEAVIPALAMGHRRLAHPIHTFATRVRDLITVLSSPTFVGSARMYAWFEDDKVVIWPALSSEVVTAIVSSLHVRKACLGCSPHDPRDLLARGTYAYRRTPRSTSELFLREDTPIEPLDIATAARLLGRSPAELAATQLDIRFAEATRVTLARMRWAT